MLDYVDWSRAGNIAELGPGDGAVTSEILKRKRPGAHLTAYEVRPDFCSDLEEMADGQLTVVNDSAEKLNFRVDAVISSVPMAGFSIVDGRSPTLDAVVRNLAPEGQFVHHQYLPGMGAVLRNYFREVERRLVFCMLGRLPVIHLPVIPAILPVYNCRRPII